jgi:hypothetical protein
MGILDAAGRVAAGATVELRPSGSSMVPVIRSRQRVIVAPVDPAKLEVGLLAGTTDGYLIQLHPGCPDPVLANQLARSASSS